MYVNPPKINWFQHAFGAFIMNEWIDEWLACMIESEE